MLGAALLTSGAITEPQLDAALDRQRVTGLRLGESLLALEFINEETLSRALAAQARVPFVSMTAIQPDRAVARLVPEPFARKHLLAAVALKGSTLEVVQSNPLDVRPLDDLSQFTSRPVSALCAPPADVRAFLDWCYSDADEDQDDASSTTPEPRPTGALYDDEAVVAPTCDSDDRRVRLLPELGFSRTNLSLVTDLLNGSGGLVLVTGPDGAVMPTLHSMLTHLVDSSKSVVTIERTVDVPIPGARHVQIDPTTGFTYAVALRAMLRQYPGVIVVDDIEEPEAAEMALRAAQSGILVLTTLTESDAPSAVARLLDMRLAPYLLASYLTGVIAQRMVRLICANCKGPVTYSDEVMKEVGLSWAPDVTLSRGRGCVQCGGTGYRGRTGAYEILVVDSALQALICERADTRAIVQAAADTGMTPLCDDALAKAILQHTTLEEVVRLRPGVKHAREFLL